MGGSEEQKFDHPTQKPCELMRRPILNHTKRGELVYEPFLGSGTTFTPVPATSSQLASVRTGGVSTKSGPERRGPIKTESSQGRQRDDDPLRGGTGDRHENP